MAGEGGTVKQNQGGGALGAGFGNLSTMQVLAADLQSKQNENLAKQLEKIESEAIRKRNTGTDTVTLSKDAKKMSQLDPEEWLKALG